MKNFTVKNSDFFNRRPVSVGGFFTIISQLNERKKGRAFLMGDLWTRLSKTKKPLIVYGMGNGADKLTAELNRRGCVVSAYFASDAFVRGQTFRGQKVLSFSEVESRFSDFIILVAFGSRLASVMATIKAMDQKYELYIPDLPVVGEEVFDEAFFLDHGGDWQKVRSLWADELSRSVWDSMVAYKLSGLFESLMAVTSEKNAVYHELLEKKNYKTYLDLGAYDGDSILEWLAHFPATKRVYAWEPDPRNYRRLQKNIGDRGLTCVKVYPYAAWSGDEILSFSAAGNRNATLFAQKREKIHAYAPDMLLQGCSIDFIKVDVEGSEYNALQGCKNILTSDSPDLALSLYHRREDLFRLPLLVHSLLPHHCLYLRRFPCFPAWELNLYAVLQR